MHCTNLIVALCLLPMVAQAGTLRVCSEPNNLPFSNRAGQGFENKIANLVARDLGDTVAYTYALQNDKFIKHTLDAYKCDVMIGVSAGMDEVGTTTPYYASTYVFVTRKKDKLNLSSLADPRLHSLKIGVHLIGDEATPPAIALGQEGIVNNVHGYMIYGDFAKPNPPARLIEAVENKDVDTAIVWGPLGGYFAKQSTVPLSIVATTDTQRFAPLKFRFAIAMGVRKDDGVLRDKLNAVIAREEPEILNILAAFGVPLVELKETPMDKLRWTMVGIGIVIIVVLVVALARIVTPGAPPAFPVRTASSYSGIVPAGMLLRVPVSGIYPGGNPAGLYANMKNPLANDPDAVMRGMKDFDAFNCSGCHMAHGGGGMGPALSDSSWIYRSSPANIYLDIVQGRSAGMPAFGAMLPDRTVWELVAYVQSLSANPQKTFGTTTSANPQSPDIEQIPAGQTDTPTPWQQTEPMPPNGEKSPGEK